VSVRLLTKRRSRPRGFTLVETLIALTILALIGTLTYGVFARSMSARNQAERVTTHYHGIRQAMLRMSREISMAFLSEHRLCEEPRTMTAFIAKRTGAGMRLDFTSFSHDKHVKDAKESDQNELGYWVGHDKEDSSKSVLIRREQSRIDDEPDEGGVEEVIGEDITELKFSFYDAKEDRWDEEWDTTRADYKGRLPMFVKLELKAKDPAGKDETFVTKTRVFLKRPIFIGGQGAVRCGD